MLNLKELFKETWKDNQMRRFIKTAVTIALIAPIITNYHSYYTTKDQLDKSDTETIVRENKEKTIKRNFFWVERNILYPIYFGIGEEIAYNTHSSKKR